MKSWTWKIFLAVVLLGLTASGATVNWTNTAGLNVSPYGPGDIVNLWGTFTNSLSITNGGTAGNPITFFFQPGANFTAPAWSSYPGAIYCGKNYVTIDGGQNGLIQNTANGTGLAHSVDSVGVYGDGASDFTVKNLTVANLYVRTGTTDEASFGSWAIVDRGTAVNMENFVVTNCTIHDAVTGIVGEYDAGCSNFVFSGNTIFSVNHGIDVPDRNSTSTLTLVTISGNHIYGFTNWTDTAGNQYHHNAVYCWSVQGGTSQIGTVNANGNTFGPGLGGAYQTAELFIQGAITNVLAYNNAFSASSGEYASEGLLSLSSSKNAVFNVFNNTFVAGDLGAAIQWNGTAATAQTISITNNLGSGGGAGTYIAFYDVGTGAQTFGIDNNLCYNFDGSTPFIYSTTGSYVGKSFAQWQGLGFDVHGLTANPLLNGNGTPQALSPAIAAGANLSAYFATDYAGNARPSTGPWTIGAYEYGAMPPPNPSTNTTLIQFGNMSGGGIHL